MAIPLISPNRGSPGDAPYTVRSGAVSTAKCVLHGHGQLDRVTRADSLMRGPLNAISGLAAKAAAAEQPAQRELIRSADLYLKIASELGQHGYRGPSGC